MLKRWVKVRVFPQRDFNNKVKEQVEKIHKFLKNMKDPYKIVFELRIHGELSFEKIGRIFGKSSGWARVTYYRAKMKILEYMEAENNE